ncbi:MAG: T9SS type A sorting domain-containing protein, partial [Bacteroidales bacterium]|nr:T9SS type A sorting domain-containing protein [Bacteroidales bacterium]
PQGSFDAHSYCLVVSYNRNTGSPVDYYVVDTVNDCNVSHNSLAVFGDDLLLNVDFGFNHAIKETALCKINKYTKEVIRSSPIRYNSIAICKNMYVNDHGWVFRGEIGDEPRVYDSIFIGNYQEASVMTFFYDSALDLHRPKPCSPVDSLWSDGTAGHTVTLSWSSSASHPGYELAYIPETGSWDNATIVETSDTTLDVTLPDDGCHLFRVRALCDGNRRPHSPWSDTITVCTQVGIDNVGTLEFTVSPNPTTGQLTIQMNQQDPFEVTICDVNGKALWNSKCENQVSEIDLSTLAAGQYLLVVRTKDKYGVKTIVKK